MVATPTSPLLRSAKWQSDGEYGEPGPAAAAQSGGCAPHRWHAWSAFGSSHCVALWFTLVKFEAVEKIKGEKKNVPDVT